MTPEIAIIIDNLERAIALIELTPEKDVDLFQFKRKCGTVHCTAGWLTTDPHFQAQGMGLKLEKQALGSYRSFLTNTKTPGACSYNYEWLDALFGANAFNNLFAEYGEGHNDNQLVGAETGQVLFYDAEYDEKNDGKPVSDKTLALLRLRHYLSMHKTLAASPSV